MVQSQLKAMGVRDQRVLDAMAVVPRHEFVTDPYRSMAYQDCPLPISAGQTISQPYIVALMIECLRLQGDERVLEIGTGSGYAAAVLAEMVAQVHTVERIEALAKSAAATLERLGVGNVTVIDGDGSLGLPAHAPYDAILVSAGAPAVPQRLQAQLSVGGRLVIPVGADQSKQELLRITRVQLDRFERESVAQVRFVPLVGDDAWSAAS
jgi:protein-L-isoaspartate(D-aspartate) O-methyltransferase